MVHVTCAAFSKDRLVLYESVYHYKYSFARISRAFVCVKVGLLTAQYLFRLPTENKEQSKIHAAVQMY